MGCEKQVFALISDSLLKQTDQDGSEQSNDPKAVQSLEYRLADMLSYIFYLPLFYTGPILTYDLFRMQVRQGTGHNLQKRRHKLRTQICL